MRRIARVTPTIIIGIFGSCGQSVERETVMSVDIQSITFRQLKTAKKHSVLICWKLSMPFPSSPYYFTLISLLKGWKVLPWNVTKILTNYFHCYFGTFSCCVQIQSQMLRRKVRISFSNDDHLKIIFKFSKKIIFKFTNDTEKKEETAFQSWKQGGKYIRFAEKQKVLNFTKICWTSQQLSRSLELLCSGARGSTASEMLSSTVTVM